MARAPEKESLFIDGPTGRLQAMLEVPAGQAVADATAVAVLCHPHPLYQGTMLNKVVHTLARAMNELGLPALRFNFRGVGASEGTYADGEGETADARAVTDYVRARWPAAQLWLAGFSFGAVVAARVASAAGASQLVTIAPAVNMLGTALTQTPAMPWLIIQGAADELVPVADVEAWVAAHQPGPELVVMPETDHFFHGQLVGLRRLLVDKLHPAAAGLEG